MQQKNGAFWPFWGKWDDLAPLGNNWLNGRGSCPFQMGHRLQCIRVPTQPPSFMINFQPGPVGNCMCCPWYRLRWFEPQIS